jgi:CelD/BcsL family acetyltransferase involved in cellulose biosynthesis
MSSGSQGSGDLRAVEVRDAEDPAWHRFVAGHPDATCFHQPAWLATLADAYGLRPLVVVQRDAEGELTGGLPIMEVRRLTGGRRWSCLPFSDECAPLVALGFSAGALLSGADALRRSRGIADLEVRAGLDLPGVVSRQVAVTHRLALQASPDGETGGARPRASVRRHVATARRQGVQVHLAETVDDLVGTYYRLHVGTRRRQGVPAQPLRYFRVLWERVLEPGDGFLLIARHGDRALAGAVFLRGGRTVTYKYGASDDRSLSLRPNHAVMSAAIEWATERRYTWFDFGRTDLDNPGLMRFKESWGAQERPLCYTSLSGPPRYHARSPLHVVAAPVIRHSPALVCRGLGHLLYRYAA